MVLPHHAVWEKARLAKVMSRAASRFDVRLSDGTNLCAQRISWKRRASNLTEIARGACNLIDQTHSHNIILAQRSF